MTITVNGEARELAGGLTLPQLIESVAGTLRGTAAVVDGEVVPRSEWPAYRLRDGQHVELVTAVQGG